MENIEAKDIGGDKPLKTPVEEEGKQETTESNKGKEDQPEMVTLSKAKFDQFMERMDRLESAADKKQLSRYDSMHKGDMGRIVNLLTMNGKVILSWSDMIKNMVEKNPRTKVWEEDQITEVTYEDGKKEKMPYVVFSRRYDRIPAKVISETKKDNGDVMLKVKTVEEDREYDVNVKFVN